MAAIEVEANTKIKTGEQIKEFHQSQGHWMGPARAIGVEGSNLWVLHGATAITCAKEQVRMTSPAEKEMRENDNKTWCARTATATTRSDWTTAARNRDNKTDLIEKTQQQHATDSIRHDRAQNNNTNSTYRILSHQSRCRHNNPHQHSNRIVEVLRLKLKRAQNEESEWHGAEAHCDA